MSFAKPPHPLAKSKFYGLGNKGVLFLFSF
nr:MAG TPA: hypothetical protein [Bacteriophage sp.]